MKVILILLMFFSIPTFSFSKEILTEEKLRQFLTEKNPNIYSILGKIYIYEGKLKFYEGEFDTKLKLTYEKKEYPISKATYYDFFIEQPFFQGFNVKFGYRKAKGTQEYNNIKTSQDGELLFGLEIPIINTLFQIDKRRMNLIKYENIYSAVNYEAQNKLRKFYFKLIKTYYKAIYYNKVLQIEKELLEKSQERIYFVKKKVEEGLFPEIYMVEARQHVLSRRQKVLETQNKLYIYLNRLSLLLDIPLKKLLQDYKLPDDIDIPKFNLEVEKLIKLAESNRPDIKELTYKLKVISTKEKYYKLYNYPNININLYATKDFKYDYGYKFSVSSDFYLLRKKFIGKMVELSKSKVLIRKKINLKLKKIKTELLNLTNTLSVLEKNIRNAKQELKLSIQLEKAEELKFKLGRSDLFYLNKREMYSLKTKKKLIKYKLKYILTSKKILITAGLLK